MKNILKMNGKEGCIVRNIKRFMRILLCGSGLHIWVEIENAQFYATGKYKCKNCGRTEIFPNN